MKSPLLFLFSTGYTWIGCNDIAHEGRFVWSHNNQVVTYSKWSSGQPDNGRKTEDCCMLLHHGYWNDDQCYNSHKSFICKKTGIISNLVIFSFYF